MIESGSISDIPPDYPDELSPEPPVSNSQVTEWYNADFPYSTPENPYGYFENGDGTPDYTRPRKRRPHGYTGDAKPSPGAKVTVSSPRGAARTTAASESQAR